MLSHSIFALLVVTLSPQLRGERGGDGGGSIMKIYAIHNNHIYEAFQNFGILNKKVMNLINLSTNQNYLFQLVQY